MSRAIKFRAWDGKTMHTDVDILYRWGAIKYGYTASPWLETAKAGTPMQFTGLHDKRGKEIYEGDILRHNEHPEGCGEVIFRYGGFSSDCAGWGDNPLAHEAEFAEIIGNVYENPELLECNK